jgi:hypothetical protein
VKRESVNLTGKGVISLGIVPEQNAEDVILFRCEPGTAPK